MANLITRETAGRNATPKGTALSNAEIDGNLIAINSELVDLGSNLSIAGVNSAALHRSPNAVTAMFVYDTSKDSDGGAWTEKCQHTSWWNESIAGAWLGAQLSETHARNANALLGVELVTNAEFNSGLTGWTSITSGGPVSVSGGVASFGPNTAGNWAGVGSSAFTTVSGRTYCVTVKANALSRQLSLKAGTSSGGSQYLNQAITTPGPGVHVFYFQATSSTAYVELTSGANVGDSASIDYISVREVIAQATASNDYFQLSSDGKFYRLWKNLWNNSAGITGTWNGYGDAATYMTPGAITAPDGTQTGILFTTRTGNVGHFGVGTLTYSYYVKQGTSPTVALSWAGVGAAGNWLFDFSTQQLTVNAYWTNPVVTSVGDGWFRISATKNSEVLSNYYFNLGTASAGQTAYIWGSQVEYGSTVTAYEAKAAGAGAGIGEVFRGNKRDFPRVAAIVAEATNVNIYDLTEPGRPMWMRFVGSWNGVDSPVSNMLILLSSEPVSAVFALNGTLSVAANNNTNEPLKLINFPADSAIGFDSRRFRYRGNIAQRNSAQGNMLVPGSGLAISRGYGVAMTVLPDAPIDPATGLRVPTIAAGTSAGVFLIRHDGSVVTTFGCSTTLGGSVRFSAKTILATRNAGSWGRGIALPNDTFISFLGNGNDWWGFSDITDAATGHRGGSFGANDLASYGAGVLFNRFDKTRIGSATSGRATGITASIMSGYNTGFMTGDIRRTYLSDNTTGSVTGPELVTNGTFDSNISGWTTLVGSPTATWDSSGSLKLETSVATQNYVFQSIPVIPGQAYVLTLTHIRSTQSTYFDIRQGTLANPGTQHNDTNFVGGGGTLAGSVGLSTVFRRLVIPTMPFLYIQLRIDGVGDVGRFDDISVRAASADRSYKAATAPITGTLIKTAVASAAELVAYSGFSGGNYAREPYSADLDFGTGEWSVSAWVNIPASGFGKNLASFTESFAVSTVWMASGPTVTDNYTTAPNGLKTAARLLFSNTNQDIRWTNNYARNTAHISSIYVKGTAGETLWYGFAAANTGLLTLDGTWQRISLQWDGTGTTTSGFAVGTWGGATARDVNVWGFQIEVNSTATSYSPVNALAYPICARSHSSGAQFAIGIDDDGRLSVVAHDGTTTRTVTSAAAYNTATWLKVRANYTTDGTLALLVNGVEVAATRGNPLLTLNNASATLTIGNSFALDAAFPGSIALLKLTATVPTTEQAQWMYAQEAQLFRAGAKCCLPDSGAIADLTYDDATDRWIAVSAANESEWSGLVRTSVTPVPAGSYTKAAAGSGIQLLARSTTNPGVDITIPAYAMREELVRRAEAAARLSKDLVSFDYVGGFTASTTNGNTAITSVANLTYPLSYVGARVTGSGIPANTTIVAVSGSTIYLSAAATATATGVQINFVDFILPMGYEAEVVSTAGAVKREGATSDWTRLFDGFKETIRFGTAPGNTTWVQIQASRSVQ